MLTVLWRKPDGSEELFAAQRVRRSSNGIEQVPASGKFIVDGVERDDIPGSTFEFEIEQPFGAVFVMNADGRTVARYMAG